MKVGEVLVITHRRRVKEDKVTIYSLCKFETPKTTSNLTQMGLGREVVLLMMN